MNIPNSAVPGRIVITSSNENTELRGGEPLEGSGFEPEDPEPGFQSELPGSTVQPEGGDK